MASKDEESRMSQTLVQIDQLQEDYSNLAEKLLMYMDKISKLKEEKVRIKSKAKQSQKEIKNLNSKLDSTEKELEVSNKALKDLEAHNSNMKIKFERFEQEKKELQKQLQSERINLEQISLNYANLSSNVDQMNNSHEQSMQSMSENMNQITADNSKLRNENQSLKQANKIYERENKRLEQQVVNKNNRIVQITAETSQRETSFRDNERELKSQIMGLTNEVRAVKNDLIISQGHVKNLESQLKSTKGKTELQMSIQNGNSGSLAQSHLSNNSRNKAAESNYSSKRDDRSIREHSNDGKQGMLYKKESQSEIVVGDNRGQVLMGSGQNYQDSQTPIKQNQFRSTSNLSRDTNQDIKETLSQSYQTGLARRSYPSLIPTNPQNQSNYNSTGVQGQTVKIYGEVQQRHEDTQSRSKSPSYIQMKVKTSINSNSFSAKDQPISEVSLSQNHIFNTVDGSYYVPQKKLSSISDLSKKTKSSKDDSLYMLRTKTNYGEHEQIMYSSAHIRYLFK